MNGEEFNMRTKTGIIEKAGFSDTTGFIGAEDVRDGFGGGIQATGDI